MQEEKCSKCGDSGYIIKLVIYTSKGIPMRNLEVENCDCPDAAQKRAKLINLKRKGVFLTKN